MPTRGRAVSPPGGGGYRPSSDSRQPNASSCLHEAMHMDEAMALHTALLGLHLSQIRTASCTHATDMHACQLDDILLLTGEVCVLWGVPVLKFAQRYSFIAKNDVAIVPFVPSLQSSNDGYTDSAVHHASWLHWQTLPHVDLVKTLKVSAHGHMHTMHCTLHLGILRPYS